MVDATWLWMGFHHHWDETSHRFRDLESQITGIRAVQVSGSNAVRLEGSLQGRQTVGVCRDKLHYSVRKKGIRTSLARFVHRDSAPIQVSGRVGRFRSVVETIPIPLGELQDCDVVTIFMRGFSIQEHNPDVDGHHAYPFRRFGMAVSGLTRVGNSCRAKLHIWLGSTRKPDVVSPTPNPWSFSVQFHYTLVGGMDGQFAVTHQHHTFERPTVELNRPRCKRPSQSKRRVSIHGQPPVGNLSWHHGVAVLRGFDIFLNHSVEGIAGPPMRLKGRLVRSMDVGIKEQPYNPETGVVRVLPDIHFCNQAAVYYATNVRYQGFYSLLQFAEDHDWRETRIQNDAGGGENSNLVGETEGYCYNSPLETSLL